MDDDIRYELMQIRLATNRMIQHIDFVEKHINWVQKLIVLFTPSFSRFFSTDVQKHDFDDIV